jgi:hypothetical protein
MSQTMCSSQSRSNIGAAPMPAPTTAQIAALRVGFALAIVASFFAVLVRAQA